MYFVICTDVYYTVHYFVCADYTLETIRRKYRFVNSCGWLNSVNLCIFKLIIEY